MLSWKLEESCLLRLAKALVFAPGCSDHGNSSYANDADVAQCAVCDTEGRVEGCNGQDLGARGEPTCRCHQAGTGTARGRDLMPTGLCLPRALLRPETGWRRWRRRGSVGRHLGLGRDDAGRGAVHGALGTGLRERRASATREGTATWKARKRGPFDGVWVTEGLLVKETSLLVQEDDEAPAKAAAAVQDRWDESDLGEGVLPVRTSPACASARRLTRCGPGASPEERSTFGRDERPSAKMGARLGSRRAERPRRPSVWPGQSRGSGREVSDNAGGRRLHFSKEAS